MSDNKTETNDTANDEQLISQIESLLGDWRNEVMASVSAIRDEFEERLTAGTKPANLPDEPANQALANELRELKDKLHNERVTSKVKDLAQEYGANANLLTLALKNQGKLIESNGQIYHEVDGVTRALSDSCQSYLSTDEGKMLISKPSVPDYSVGSPTQNSVDPISQLIQSL